MSDDQLVDLGLLFDGRLVLKHLLRRLLLGPLVVGLWSQVDDLDVDSLEQKSQVYRTLAAESWSHDKTTLSPKFGLKLGTCK